MPEWVALFRGINVGGRNALNLERHLGVVTTGRNWRTVENITAMIDSP